MRAVTTQYRIKEFCLPVGTETMKAMVQTVLIGSIMECVYVAATKQPQAFFLKTRKARMLSFAIIVSAGLVFGVAKGAIRLFNTYPISDRTPVVREVRAARRSSPMAREGMNMIFDVARSLFISTVVFGAYVLLAPQANWHKQHRLLMAWMTLSYPMMNFGLGTTRVLNAW